MPCSYFLVQKVSNAFTYTMERSATLADTLQTVAVCLRALSLLSAIPVPPVDVDVSYVRQARAHEIHDLLATYPPRQIDRRTAQWLILRLSEFLLDAKVWDDTVRCDSIVLSELWSTLSRRSSFATIGRNVADARAWAVFDECEARRIERDLELQRWVDQAHSWVEIAEQVLLPSQGVLLSTSDMGGPELMGVRRRRGYRAV